MELFTIAPDAFEAELLNYDLRLRDTIRAFPPNCTYSVKGSHNQSPMHCGIIVGYGLMEPKIISGNAIPCVTMAFLIKPTRDQGGFALSQTISEIPVATLQETALTPESWYERVYKMRHPLTWMDLLRLGTKRLLMDQEGAVRKGHVAEPEAVAAEAGKES